jgi:hypothetical protein
MRNVPGTQSPPTNVSEEIWRQYREHIGRVHDANRESAMAKLGAKLAAYRNPAMRKRGSLRVASRKTGPRSRAGIPPPSCAPQYALIAGPQNGNYTGGSDEQPRLGPVLGPDPTNPAVEAHVYSVLTDSVSGNVSLAACLDYPSYPPQSPSLFDLILTTRIAGGFTQQFYPDIEPGQFAVIQASARLMGHGVINAMQANTWANAGLSLATVAGTMTVTLTSFDGRIGINVPMHSASSSLPFAELTGWQGEMKEAYSALDTWGHIVDEDLEFNFPNLTGLYGYLDVPVQLKQFYPGSALLVDVDLALICATVAAPDVNDDPDYSRTTAWGDLRLPRDELMVIQDDPATNHPLTVQEIRLCAF